MQTTILMFLAVAVVFIVAATSTPTGARHRRRRRTAASLDWIRPPQVPATTVAAAQEQPVAGQDSQLLRNRVRALEEALARAQLSTTNRPVEPDLQTYRRRVGTVIRALGANLESAEVHQALARLSAGIDRLVMSEPFARPALTAAQNRSGAPACGPTDEAAVLSLVPESPSTTGVQDTDDAQPVSAESSAETIAAPEVVLPVPAMAQPVSSRRSRGWFNRGRAA